MMHGQKNIKLVTRYSALKMEALYFSDTLVISYQNTQHRSWTVRRSNPDGGARFPAPVQTGPGAHPASYIMGNWCCSKHVEECSVTYILLKIKRIVH
jgi:hypothetical protein